jgi:AcrR family transcriptional regulator
MAELPLLEKLMTGALPTHQPALDQAPAGRPPTQLRSRRRARNATEAERVALHLFAEYGYGLVTIGDIAAATGISPRTFSRYFPAKEDVVLAGILDRLGRVSLTLWQRPPDEPAVVALRAALAGVAGAVSVIGDPVERDRATVLGAEPAILRHGLDRLHHHNGQLVEVMAYRMRVDPRRDLRPGVIVAAMIGALRAGWQQALRSGRSDQVVPLTANALDLMVVPLTSLAEAR